MNLLIVKVRILFVLVIIKIAFVYLPDFATLHACYHFLHHLLPIKKLQKYLNEKQISDILRFNRDDYTNASKRIIMFLTEKITCKEYLFDFCYQLEMITTSHYMASVIKSIRLGEYFEVNILITM